MEQRLIEVVINRGLKDKKGASIEKKSYVISLSARQDLRIKHKQYAPEA
ncbi:MAG: hypothetical protein ACTTJC_01635 [Campylobacter sp.]